MNNTPEIDPAFEDPTFTQDDTHHVGAMETPIVPIAARVKDWQKNADELVEGALAGIPSIICGLEMNEFSTARGSLLRRINSEFVGGVDVSQIKDPFLSVGKFLVIMSSTLADARKLVAREEKLDDAAYELLDKLPLRDIGDVVTEINAFVHKEMSNQVHGEIPEGDGASDSSAPKN